MISGDILFETNPNPMWVYDLETLAILEVNKAAITKYGYTKEQFLQLTLLQLRPADDIPALQQKVKEIATEQLSSQSIWKHKDVNDRIFHVKIASNYTLYNGRPARLTVVTDVEDLMIQQAEINRLNRQLQQHIGFSEERFRSAFENSAIGMALVSHEGRFLQLNQALCRILGYGEEELLAKHFQEITYPADLQADLNYLNELMAGRLQSYQLEKRYFHKKGMLVWTVLTVSISRTDLHGPVSFVAQVLDITERKAKEQQLRETVAIITEQNNRLNNFAYIVSHNLRTHSNHFELILDLLESTPEATERAVLLERMNRISTQLRESIEHLNDIISIQASQQAGRKKLYLKAYIDKALELLAAETEQTSASIAVLIDERLQVECIPAYLESILLNFLSNAIKYRRPGIAPEVTISSWMENGKTILEIADNGLGIDLAMYGDKLFGMYQTFHGNTDAKGIGLFIARNQVEAMGGKVEVRSEVNKGSSFKIYL